MKRGRGRGRPSFEEKHGESSKGYHVRLPQSVYDDASEEAARRDVSLNDLIITCLKKCLGRD